MAGRALVAALAILLGLITLASAQDNLNACVDCIMSPKCTNFEGGGELCVKTAGICKEECAPVGAGGSGEDTPGGTDGAGGSDMPSGTDNTGGVNPGVTTTGEAGPTGGGATGGTPGGVIRKPNPRLFKPKPVDTGSGGGGAADEDTGPDSTPGIIQVDGTGLDSTPSIIQAEGARTKPGGNDVFISVISGGMPCQAAYDAVKESLSTNDKAGEACAFAEKACASADLGYSRFPVGYFPLPGCKEAALRWCEDYVLAESLAPCSAKFAYRAVNFCTGIKFKEYYAGEMKDACREAATGIP